MAGDSQHIEHAASKIDGSGIGGPVRNARRLLNSGDRGGNELNLRYRLKLFVARGVVAMVVRVNHHELDPSVIRLLGQLLQKTHDERRGSDLSRAGVLEQCFLVAEN